MISKLYEFTRAEDENSLTKKFEELASYLIYRGYFHCSERYDLYITSVEFYFHDEKEDRPNRIVDPIMYHRNKKKKSNPKEIKTPYFKIGTIYPHQSGIDITFENEEKEYRASALIRSFEIVLHIDEHTERQKEDDRSTYVYEYLFDGLNVDGSPGLKWIEINNNPSQKPNEYPRKNVHRFRPIKEVEGTEFKEGVDYISYDAEYVKMIKEQDTRRWRFVKIGSKYDK